LRYESELIIDLPRERVIELFDDPANLPKWQKSLRSFEHISGEPGQPGAKSRLIYDIDGRDIEMTETIINRSPPDEFSGLFEAEGVWNSLNNHFYEDGPGKTRWVLDSEFKFSGLMRIMSLFMKGSFSMQTADFMNDFKKFAEAESSDTAETDSLAES
jgi:hypothetical protein